MNIRNGRLPTRLDLLYAERERRRRLQVVHARAAWTTEGVEWRKDALGTPRPYIEGTSQRLSWAPQPGSQAAFLASTTFEVLFTGGRGIGKSEALLMDFAQFCEKGFGADHNGILFRRTFPELRDIKRKAKRWFPAIFPNIRYNESTSEWKWKSGETLRFAYARVPDDYWNYHGNEYNWMGWEELTTWPNDELFTQMLSLLRSSNPLVPRHVRSNTNPHGPGNSWVKLRYKLPVPNGILNTLHPEGENPRAVYHGRLEENRVFLSAEPEYEKQLNATKDPMKRKAWKFGDWNITAGGMFDDEWSEAWHVLPAISADLIPKTWRIDRAYDHGTARPYSCGIYAESNGEPITVMKKFRDKEGNVIERPIQVGAVRGDIIRFAEVYGWNGEPNTGTNESARVIARKILAHLAELGIEKRCHPGPADSAIYSGSQDDPNKSVGSIMEEEGLFWLAANKGPGSRENGWEVCRNYLVDAKPNPDGFRENPGFYVTETCEQFLRTVPVLTRSSTKPSDVGKEQEDHVGDEWRYRLTAPPPGMSDEERMAALAAAGH